VKRRPLLLGHRGCRTAALTENSLPAFEYALSQGCDGFEFDVRHTRDGRNVLWHDPEWHSKKIASTAYTELVDGQGNRLACFDEVLQQFGEHAFLDTELKFAGNEESIVAALQASPPQCGFIVSSFLPQVLLRLHELDGKLPLGFICDRREAISVYPDLPIRFLLPHHGLVRSRLVDEAHQRGLQIMAWTLNDKRRMLELAEWGIDGLISDDPQLLYQTFHPA